MQTQTDCDGNKTEGRLYRLAEELALSEKAEGDGNVVVVDLEDQW